MIKFDTLMALALRSAAVTQKCNCATSPFLGWERVPPSFPESHMRQVGSLLEDPYAEPSYAEYHPSATGYWSELAPIAPQHFPYNRCSVVECTMCGRMYLRYMEAGGYYAEQRIRALFPERLVDAPAPAS
jgi:hypothetical protein